MVMHLFLQLAHPALQRDDVLPNRVGQVHVIQINLRRDALAADDAAGVADHRAVGRHRLEHHRQRADFAAAADGERAEHLCARADDHVIPDGRVALAHVLARAAQRHALIERHVVADHRRFADHHAVAVVNEKALADARAGVNLDAGYMAAVLGEPARQRHVTAQIEPVRHAVIRHRLDRRIAQQHLPPGFCRRVALHHRGDIRAKIVKHLNRPLRQKSPAVSSSETARPRFHSV